MTAFALAPLTDAEVYARATQADRNVAYACRSDLHQASPAAFAEVLDECRDANVAREQRLYGGLEGVAA